MEKIGGKRNPEFRAGLLKFAFWAALIFVFYVIYPMGIFPADVELRLSSTEFFEGEPFTLAFIFYGLNPDEIQGELENISLAGEISREEIFNGIIPGSFKVDAYRKTLSFLSPPGVSPPKTVPATVITLDITASEPGNFISGPFIFSAAGERVVFDPVTIYVRNSVSSLLNGGSFYTGTNIFWLLEENSSFVTADNFSGVPAGTRVVIVLAVPSELKGRVSCSVPENAILESAGEILNSEGFKEKAFPPGVSCAEAFYWTPLFSGNQSLPQAVFSFTSETSADVSLSPTPVYVEVLSAPSNLAENKSIPSKDTGGNTGEFQPAAVKIDMPSAFGLETGSDRVFELNVAAKCRELWREGSYASAAVLLRTAENTSFFSPKITEMRRAVDNILSVKGNSSGKIVRVVLFLPLFLLPAGLLFLSGALFLRIKSCGNRAVRPLFFAGVILTSFGLFFSGYIKISGGVTESASTGGVLFLIPETKSTPVTSVPPGTPLKILEKAGGWYYVETNSGESGWYPFDSTVVYTSGDLNEFR